MSSPHPQSKNAAPAVPLSPLTSSPSDSGSGGRSGGAEGLLFTHPPASSGEATPSDVNVDVDVDPSLHQPTLATPTVAPDGSREDGKDHKKTRGSSHSVSQQGPSLLTQALASARGIAKQPSAQPSSPSYQNQDNTASSAVSPTDAPRLPPLEERSNASKQATSSTADKQRNAHPQHGDNTTLTSEPRPPPSSTMAAPATIPAHIVPTPTSRRDATSVPSSFSRSTFTEVRDMFYETRKPFGPTLRRSSTSLDIDRKRASSTENVRSSLYAAATDDESTTPTKSSYLTGDALPQVADNAFAKDSYRQRPAPPEHRFTSGPEKTEKIWSIGSGEGLDEDGLVEKSVTEAMTGVEHNARSRKASYSLRFFKEGLPPDDKTRRREPRTTQREKLPATAEEDQHEKLKRAQLLNEIRQRRQSSTTEEPRRPSLDSPSLASQASTSLATEAEYDYFGLEKNPTHQTTPTSSGTPPLPAPDHGAAAEPEGISPHHIVEAISVPDDQTERPQVVEERRASGDSTEVPDSHDDVDADESGEEKISSAVFVPHHEMGETRPRDIPGPASGVGARPRSICQEETHTWLVKADEPEPHIDQPDEHPGRLSRFRSRESLISSREELISDAASEEFPLDGEEEVAAQFTATRAGTQYDDHGHVHDHQHRISQPLEAIELIPYKHQVGGHTTIWRFSRRAVCKQLNNRENEFYETIERYHRDLLPFLPRYVKIVPSYSMTCI